MLGSAIGTKWTPTAPAEDGGGSGTEDNFSKEVDDLASKGLGICPSPSWV